MTVLSEQMFVEAGVGDNVDGDPEVSMHTLMLEYPQDVDNPNPTFIYISIPVLATINCPEKSNLV